MLGLLAYALGRIPFNHRLAQVYEHASSRRTMRASFARLYGDWEAAKAQGSLWNGAQDQWFCGNTALWETFVAHVRERTCVEIGSGPYGYLAPAYWISRRVVIDPLVDRYRAGQLRMLGKTFFTPDIETHAVAAEQVIGSLVGRVDGAIICRNALDHCDDPLKILDVMSGYAASGCYLLLWTDIWHIGGAPIGHRNITRSVDVMDKLLDGLGFDIVQPGATVRPPGAVVEYGRLARKR
jgi:hypothetical protein